MNEVVDMTAEWYGGGWDSPPVDGEDPQDRLNEYIISPDPLPDSQFDEGGCD
jgi:hypothetical protein